MCARQTKTAYHAPAIVEHVLGDVGTAYVTWQTKAVFRAPKTVPAVDVATATVRVRKAARTVLRTVVVVDTVTDDRFSIGRIRSFGALKAIGNGMTHF